MDAVLDLDGVLSTRDTVATLLVEAARRQPRRATGSLPQLVRWVLAGGDVARHAAASRAVAAAMLRGMPEPEYDALAREVGTRMGRTAARASMVRIARELAAEGAHVVVATGSEQRLAAAFLDSAGVPRDLLLASTLAWGPEGPAFDRHIRGASKLEALLRAGIDVGARRFWTDSADDLPTARAAVELVLVAPSRRSEAAYLAAGLPHELLEGRG